jgi:hypothetical protein
MALLSKQQLIEQQSINRNIQHMCEPARLVTAAASWVDVAGEASVYV